MKVLITGAAGTVGRHLVEFFQREYPGFSLVLVDCDENRSFWLEKDFMTSVKLLDVLKMQACDLKNIDLVVHAAACKHVGLCERNIAGAFLNNVEAVSHLAALCWQAKVPLVHVSTDKATNPIGVYGITKAIAERVVLAFREFGLQITVVRFANVLNSSGSVLECWERQNKSRGEIEVTSKEMHRWFITGEEAAKGIWEAYRHTASDRNLFAIKPDVETKIYDLALGFQAQEGCEIKITHPQKAEKAREIFCNPGEKLVPVKGKLYAIENVIESTFLQPKTELLSVVRRLVPAASQ